jgi:pilus assembly protein Flp/PilA
VKEVKDLMKRLVREEDGQDLIEYALLAGFISLVAVAAIKSVGTGVNGVYNNINAQVAAIPGGAS